MTTAPRYEHDCKKCRFLDQYEQYDLYVCKPGTRAELVARRSADQSDYLSGLLVSRYGGPVIAEARRRAFELDEYRALRPPRIIITINDKGLLRGLYATTPIDVQIERADGCISHPEVIVNKDAVELTWQDGETEAKEE